MTDHERIRRAFSVLTAADGSEGYDPFRWQLRLLNLILHGTLPKAVDVPTGLGKTSVMALWLIALAEGAKLPRRLVYVVDRRAVVDQASRFAEVLRSNVPAEMADRLDLNGRACGTAALPVSTLRGGFADNREWLEDPTKPAIIVGTVDMVGSRMLFEGYGVSRRMRPYHAGLLAVDALVLLDEAHLCPAFEALLRRVEVERDGVLGSGGGTTNTPPFHVMSLSATGRETGEDAGVGVFRLEAQDKDEDVARRRLSARKRLGVIELEDPKGLPQQLATRAVELGTAAMPARVLVYCHSRMDAVAVKGRIDRAFGQRHGTGKSATTCESELLVGERRVRERENLERWLEKQGFLGAAENPPQVPSFLVATAAGEVGVDLNAEHMVCDLVAYERMAQRLGRVNRRGGENRSAIVDVFAVVPDRKRSQKRTEVDSEVLEARQRALLQLPLGEDGRHDASPEALMLLRQSHRSVVDAATTPAPLHPELTRPLLDAWSLTSLEQHEGRPEVGPWLRGWEEDEEPQTTVVWRKHLPCTRNGSDFGIEPRMVGDYFRVAPIHATERLVAESRRVLAWLSRRAIRVTRGETAEPLGVDGRPVAILVDRSGEMLASATLTELQRIGASASKLDPRERRQRDRLKEDWGRRLPGETLIVDATLGGVRDGMLDEKAEGEADAADLTDDWREMLDPAGRAETPLIKFRVQELVATDGEEGLRQAELTDWRHVRTFETHHSDTGTVLRGLAVYKWRDEPTDEDSRSVLSAPQGLADHAELVATRVSDFAAALGLAEEEAEALRRAARLHDDGKAVQRWQDAMNAPKDGRPYAKTRGGGNWRMLEGYRHEFGSLLKAELEPLPEATRDLILHLIAAHHGYARPWISSEGCSEGPPSLLEAKAGEAALRFTRLQKRYGPWGLAWREAVLRAADQSASREWSETSVRGSHG